MKQLITIHCATGLRALMAALMAVTIVSFSITKTKAATVNFSASVVTPGPAFGEIGIGSFTYDENALDGSGNHTFNCAGGTCDWSLSFTVFGQTFTQFDDMGYNFAAGNPDLIVQNFNSFEFDYLVAEAGAYGGVYNEIFIADPRILAWGFVTYITDCLRDLKKALISIRAAKGRVTYRLIPNPGEADS